MFLFEKEVKNNPSERIPEILVRILLLVQINTYKCAFCGRKCPHSQFKILLAPLFLQSEIETENACKTFFFFF